MNDPTLTRAEQEVANAMTQGWEYRRIAAYLGISVRTVHCHVTNIAAKIPNPDDLKPYRLIQNWAGQMEWQEKKQKPAA